VDGIGFPKNVRNEASLSPWCRATLHELAMNRIAIKKGTLLYHGTDCAGDFAIPDGPCWFALNQEDAVKWVGWSESLPEGRERGSWRVLITETVDDIDLIDVISLERWEEVAMGVCNDPEATNYAVANGLWKNGIIGWIGDQEIMLTTPDQVLTPKEVVHLQPEHSLPSL